MTSGCHPASQASALKPNAAASPPRILDLTHVQPNEAGVIPILEYHNLVNSSRVTGYEYPADEFRKDLEWLYAHNYRPIRLADYVNGVIDVPAGASPVIITFDDALVGQFAYDADNKIDPNCAVGILDDFHARHPDWPLRATFFALTDEDPKMPKPFSVPRRADLPEQGAYAQTKMDYLVKEGFEIGDHTLHHRRGLNRMPDATVEAEFAGGVAGIHKYLPDYPVQTLALPFGVFPRNPKTLIAGESGGATYHHICAMDAGWDPAPSPLSKRFHPYHIPRIIPGDEHTKPGGLNTIRYWLDVLEKNKGERFISDGDPSTYTVPVGDEKSLDRRRLDDLHFRVRTYRGTQMVDTGAEHGKQPS